MAEEWVHVKSPRRATQAEPAQSGQAGSASFLAECHRSCRDRPAQIATFLGQEQFAARNLGVERDAPRSEAGPD